MAAAGTRPAGTLRVRGWSPLVDICEADDEYSITAEIPESIGSGRQVVDWQQSLEQEWAALRFGEVKVENNRGQHVFSVQVYLDDLDPNAVRVELYADGIDGGGPVRQEMERVRQLVGAGSAYAYRVSLPATRQAADYTVRVIPHRLGVAVPLEAARILWQR